VTMTRQDRYRGALLGLAAGDALGTTLEFKGPGTFEPITDMVGGGPFRLRAGEWTDDTSMALCLAESLIECDGFEPIDQLRRYVRWYREGHNSSTGHCFDIGNSVRAALARFERTGEPWCGSTDPDTAGNGSIMRLAPVPLFYAQDPARAVAEAADSSRTTHGAPDAVDACRYLAALIVGAVEGRSKGELLQPHFAPVPGLWNVRSLFQRSRRSPAARSAIASRPRLLAPAMWSARSKRRCGPSRGAQPSRTARCSRSTSATTRTPAARSTVSWPAHSMASMPFRRAGGRRWR
jgi:ADP-ribosylglycohydrolase